MLDAKQKSSLPIIKTVLLPTLLISIMPLLTSCDSQPASSNNNVTAQTADDHKSMDNKDKKSTNLKSTNSVATNNAIEDNSQNIEVKNISNNETVNLSGYQKLSFGQLITPKLLSDLGLTKEESDNEQCYYVSNPKLSYMDKEYGKRASVLYQIIDDKVALIAIQDPNIALYTGINVGDAVAKVMRAHKDNLTYEVDKYAVDGDYYNLIANVNFKVVQQNAPEEWLKDDNIKLNNEQDNLPIQIEYHIKGGQRLNDYQIKATQWTEDNKELLQGEVESIDIGIPEAIYLVEGCS